MFSPSTAVRILSPVLHCKFAGEIQIIHISSRKVSYPARFSHHNSLSDSSVTAMRREGNTATSLAQIKNMSLQRVLIYGKRE